jgi:hypothetical protein
MSGFTRREDKGQLSIFHFLGTVGGKINSQQGLRPARKPAGQSHAR